jgi:hypothetical protein
MISYFSPAKGWFIEEEHTRFLREEGLPEESP